MSDTPVSTAPAASEPDHGDGEMSLRAAAILTAAAGVAHALLFLLAFALVSTAPGANASDDEITDYYSSGDERLILIVGGYILPFAAIAFLWFLVSLRMWASRLASRQSVLFSNLQLLSGILYLAMLMVAGAAVSVTAHVAEFTDAEIDPDLARQFPSFASALALIFAMRMGAVFVFTTSTIGRTAGILPRWFTWAGYVVGAFMLLSAAITRALELVFPVWLLVLSAILLVRALKIPREASLEDLGQRPSR